MTDPATNTGALLAPRAVAAGKPQPRLKSVQALRGVAACLVAAMHCLSSKTPLATQGDTALHDIARFFDSFGGAGVDVFFVISGFIIMTVTDHPRLPLRARTAAIRFLFRRAARIYPLYWITLSVLLALSAWAGGKPDPHALKLPVLMLTTTRIPLQDPAWSLPFELWFYAGTAALLAIRPASFRIAVAVWASMQVAFLVWHAAAGGGPHWAVLARPQVIEFFFGCGVAVAIRTRPLDARQARLLLLASAILFTCGSVVCYRRLPQGSLTDWERVAYCGIAASGLLAALVSLERRGLANLPRRLEVLGDHSYSIYLWHAPLMAASFLVCFKFGLAVPLLPRAAAEFACTLLVAGYSYRFIEKPVIGAAGKLKLPLPPAR